jgi:hypothetical protein
MSMCPMCSMGLPSSCLSESCGQPDTTTRDTLSPTETPSPTQLGIPTTEPIEEVIDEQDLDLDYSNDRSDSRSNSRGRGRSRSKRGLSDSQSSGRKVAAKLYPLNPDAPCEWQGLANCGGGDYPILGCPPGAEHGYQQARHHGPEKNVQNNEQGNVHRICHYCHYRWHAANNASYDWNAGIWPPHQPRPLNDMELKSQVMDYMRYLVKGRRKKIKETD